MFAITLDLTLCLFILFILTKLILIILFMSKNSSKSECLPDTMAQTRAKRARIQSQRPLSP